MATKVLLSIAEQIDRAREGRSQSWIIGQMRNRGIIGITDTTFSRKKNGYANFTKDELKVLSEILGTQIR